MATQLLAVGTTAATSAAFTLADGASATIAIKGTTKQAPLYVEMQDDAGAWQTVGDLSADGGRVINGPGTFRLRREANTGNIGAFRG